MSDRSSVFKAQVIGGDRTAGLADPSPNEGDNGFANAGAVEVPYDPAALVFMLEHSNSLRQCVDAIVANVHSHGYHLKSVIDLDADDSSERVAGLLWERTIRESGDGDAPLPSEEEVEAAKVEMRLKMLLEKSHLKRFLVNCSLERSFEALRAITAHDRETTGNGYWECVRQGDGQIAQFDYIPGYTMRLMPLDPIPVKVSQQVRVDDVTWGEINRLRRFRLYVQIIEQGVGEPVYFKELGDPRVVSSKTGKVFTTVDDLKAEEGDAAQTATEVYHFKVPSSRSAYGIPRWIGQWLAVLGSRQVDEVNQSYFENKSVPPLLVTVSDGRLTDDCVEDIRTHIEGEIKGRRNFHKILVLQAETTSEPGQQNSGRAKITVQPLTMAQHNDALFQRYDERNMDKVGMSFRLPRLLRGDARDFNRATASAALEFAETQVFAPERNDFDFIMNRVVLPELGIRFWKFVSNSPKLTDPLDLGKLVVDMVREGLLTPAEGREEAGDVLNRELPRLNAPWTKQPIQLTVAGIAPPPDPSTAASEGDEAVAVDDGPRLELTDSDNAAVVTVNEVRHARKLGPLKTREGSVDPDGYLTVWEFKMKRQAAGQGLGQAEAVEEVGDAAAPGGGQQQQGPSAKAFGDTVVRDAAYLLKLRNAMAEAERLDAQRDFLAGREADAADAE